MVEIKGSPHSLMCKNAVFLCFRNRIQFWFQLLPPLQWVVETYSWLTHCHPCHKVYLRLVQPSPVSKVLGTCGWGSLTCVSLHPHWPIFVPHPHLLCGDLSTGGAALCPLSFPWPAVPGLSTHCVCSDCSRARENIIVHWLQRPYLIIQNILLYYDIPKLQRWVDRLARYWVTHHWKWSKFMDHLSGRLSKISSTTSEASSVGGDIRSVVFEPGHTG